jgi:5'-phosphate synthase pdxT subunit
MGLRVGVLSLQGAVRPHLNVLQACGAEGVLVRTPEDIRRVDGLILPGGESTTMGLLMTRFELVEPMREHAHAGKPIFGTCAGMILLATDIAGSDQARLGLMAMRVQRNSFGRQVDSFEAPLEIPALGETPFPGVFIRAPHIETVEKGVEVLAMFEGRIVLARQGNLLASSFHPELTTDRRVHQYFLEMTVSSV